MLKKRVVFMLVLVVILWSGIAMAQIIVLDKYQLGKSTYEEVKANLPDKVLVVCDDPTPIDFYGGRTFSTDGTGYGVDGLRAVNFSFDKNQTLVVVGMMLEAKRLRDIKKILTSKYQRTSSKYPSSVMLFKSGQDFVELFIRPGDVFAVEYITRDIARKQSLETQYVQPEDRRKASNAGTAAPADRSKF